MSGAETGTTYVWGLDLSQRVQGAGGIGGLLMQEKDDAAGQTRTRLYTYEANGNVGQLVDGTTGAVVAHYEYDPFGTTLTASGTAAATNPFRFLTKYTDADTTLLYYGYRFYSPYLGRWLTRDPIEEKGFYLILKNNLGNITKILNGYIENYQGIGEHTDSVYTFVQNAPINYVDLYGLFWDKGKCRFCGPDVTARLDRTLQDIRNTFDSLKLADKSKACSKIYDVRGGADEAWDIVPLLGIGRGVEASYYWPETEDGTVDCEATVLYYGKCHNAGYLNYIMWGVMNQRCQKTFHYPYDTPFLSPMYSLNSAISVAKVWKWREYGNTASYPEVVAAIRAGYHESGAWPLETSLYTHCAVRGSGSNRVSGCGPLRWNWEGAHSAY